MGDATRGGPPRGDPEATQPGAPPEDAVGDGTEVLRADQAATRLAGPGGGSPGGASADRRETVQATIYSTSRSRPADADAPRGSAAYASYSGAPPRSAGVRPRRRRAARLNLPRLI